MLLYKTSTKILLTLFALGFIIWIGGTIVRAPIAFDLFETGTQLQLKEEYSSEVRMHSVYLYTMLAPYTGIGFIIALITGIALMIRWRRYMKNQGWLLMSSILFIIASIIEIIILFYDLKLGVTIYWYDVTNFWNENLQKYFVNRYKNIVISTLSGLGLLSALTIVIYTIWQPLNKSKEKTG